LEPFFYLGSYSAFRSRFFFLLQKKKQEKKSSTQVGLRATVHNLEIWKTTKKKSKPFLGILSLN
jgi:hypothetical protein